MSPSQPPADGLDPEIGWLYGLQTFGVKLGLDGIRMLLARLGEPQRRMRVVHVAGTNGKGSVSAMIDAALLAAGVRTGLYTSPHLVRPNERIRIAGRDLSDRELRHRIRRLRACIAEGLADGALQAHPSFFEVLTALALEAFADAGCEVAVLEVGLGGRLDATNAADGDVAVIVTVDLDHTQVLGETLEAIATEKAGIIKPGRPVVVGALPEVARRTVHEVARCLGAPWIEAWPYLDRVRVLDLALEGEHQVANAAVAVAALETFSRVSGIAVPDAAIVRGLAEARWPGRLQRIPGRPAIVLDGAHNAAGAQALARWLASREFGASGRVILFGASRDKDLAGLLEPLARGSRVLVATRAAVERALEPETIARTARRWFADVRHALPSSAALDVARSLAGAAGEVVVCGSLYLVGETLAHLEGRDAPGPVSM